MEAVLIVSSISFFFLPLSACYWTQNDIIAATVGFMKIRPLLADMKKEAPEADFMRKEKTAQGKSKR